MFIFLPVVKVGIYYVYKYILLKKKTHFERIILFQG